MTLKKFSYFFVGQRPSGHLSIAVAIAMGLVLGLAGCDAPNSYQAPPPPEVTVSHPRQGLVTRHLELTGNT